MLNPITAGAERDDRPGEGPGVTRSRPEHEDPRHRYGRRPEQGGAEAGQHDDRRADLRQYRGDGGRLRAPAAAESRGKASCSSGAARTAYGSR